VQAHYNLPELKRAKSLHSRATGRLTWVDRFASISAGFGLVLIARIGVSAASNTPAYPSLAVLLLCRLFLYSCCALAVQTLSVLLLCSCCADSCCTLAVLLLCRLLLYSCCALAVQTLAVLLLCSCCADMITKGFEWAYKFGEPKNMQARTYMVQPKCCSVKM